MEPQPAAVAGRRRAAVLAGHAGDAAAGRRSVSDPDASVRAAGLGALGRCGALRAGDLVAGLGDPSAVVRRRAADLAAGRVGRRSAALGTALVATLGDADPLVVAAACTALGERSERGAVGALAATSATHEDLRCRAGAVAALGAIGDPLGLPAVLARLDDRPAVRRRAVVALAAFSGPEVEAALDRCLTDRDWQVRQSAEVLLGG